MPEKQKKNKWLDHPAKGYLYSCEKLQSESPKLSQLEKETNVSRKFWYKRLRDSGFLLVLKKEAVKKANQSKPPNKEAKRAFWIKVEQGIADRIRLLADVISRADEVKDENLLPDLETMDLSVGKKTSARQPDY